MPKEYKCKKCGAELEAVSIRRYPVMPDGTIDESTTNVVEGFDVQCADDITHDPGFEWDGTFIVEKQI